MKKMLCLFFIFLLMGCAVQGKQVITEEKEIITEEKSCTTGGDLIAYQYYFTLENNMVTKVRTEEIVLYTFPGNDLPDLSTRNLINDRAIQISEEAAKIAGIAAMHEIHDDKTFLKLNIDLKTLDIDALKKYHDPSTNNEIPFLNASHLDLLAQKKTLNWDETKAFYTGGLHYCEE